MVWKKRRNELRLRGFGWSGGRILRVGSNKDTRRVILRPIVQTRRAVTSLIKKNREDTFRASSSSPSLSSSLSSSFLLPFIPVVSSSLPCPFPFGVISFDPIDRPRSIDSSVSFLRFNRFVRFLSFSSSSTGR